MRGIKIAAVAVVSCVALSACAESQPDEDSSMTTSSESSSTRAPEGSVSSTPTSSDSPSETMSSREPVAQEGCDDAVSNPLSEASSLPIVGNEEQQLTFSVIDDNFDPCAELSWSVIAGGVGTGGSQRQGVVFFHKGQPIVEPAPLMQEEVTAVTPVSSDVVEVSYAVLEGPRVAAQTVPGAATFSLNAEGTLSIVNNSLPPSADEAGIQLDLTGL